MKENGEKRITQCTQQYTGSPYKHKKGEEERESAREKIELNSLILNYYLSIMGGNGAGALCGRGLEKICGLYKALSSHPHRSSSQGLRSQRRLSLSDHLSIIRKLIF